MRLDRLLANAGCGTRSQVKKYIRLGKVKVKSEIIQDPGFSLDEFDLPAITLNDLPVKWHRFRYLLLNKPAGVITALQDNLHSTIAELLPREILRQGVVPVGRLDRDATGLLLLTSDGMLCHRLTSPHWQIWKTYEVSVSGNPFQSEEVGRFASGIVLADQTVCRPARMEIASEFFCRLTICEGKYHQVKRMMLAMGHKVETLHRVAVGPLILDSKTAPGSYRELSDEEIKDLYGSVSLPLPEK